jgi:AraC family transcriptional regulator, regulatory protein of adaptative response / methylated-DNA-[protein]-cysteine methyltransferase
MHPASRTTDHTSLVERACRMLDAAEEPLSLDAVAAAIGLSPHHFHRVFKRVTGVTPKDYQTARRIGRVGASLKTADSVTDAIYDAGFNSAGRFYENAGAMLGMTPSAFRRGGAGEEIRYAVEPCALGVILVAATVRGVCAIEFGDSAHALVDRLRERFPQARLSPADATFRGWLARILEYIEAPRGSLDLPLDIRGTAFQQQVWKALRAIPAGTTLTYTELAAQLGKPHAVRAVASAVASNKVAVAVPCHRVIGADGTMRGYRWGIERKRELLKRESEKK